MTLEEWEAKQQAGAAGGSSGGAEQAQQQHQHQLSDEELARQLQRHLDLEAAQDWGQQPHGQVCGRPLICWRLSGSSACPVLVQCLVQWLASSCTAITLLLHGKCVIKNLHVCGCFCIHHLPGIS